MDKQQREADLPGMHAAPFHGMPSVQVKAEEQLHTSFPEEKLGAAGGPQQADLLQVMQDVTGRFIANAAGQLRKRAAMLCLEELKEYKRSKALNVLNAPESRTVPHTRPSSASYLVPAVPDGRDGSSSLKASDHDPCSSNRLATAAAEQDGPAGLNAPPKAVAPPKPTQTALGQGADGASAEAQSCMQPAPARHAATGGVELSAAMPASLSHDENTSAGPSRAHTSELAGISSMNLPPASPSTSHKGTTAPQIQHCAERQHRFPAPTQHGIMTAWPQSSLQLKAPERWSPITSAHAVDCDQGKIGCAHSFAFSKQPCAVMW